jgi:hypothetical protein
VQDLQKAQWYMNRLALEAESFYAQKA